MSQRIAETVTPAQFRTQYGITTAQFKSLKQKASERTEESITYQQGRKWFITDPRFLADVLATLIESGEIESETAQQLIKAQSAPTQNLVTTTPECIPDVESSGFSQSGNGGELLVTGERISIYAGNHRGTTDAGQLPQSFDLAQFRGPQQIETVGNLQDTAQQAIAAMDAMIEAMQVDTTNREHQLAADKQATAAMQAKAEQLREAQRQYEMDSRIRDLEQRQTTEAAMQAIGEVQSLGKPQNTAPQQQQQ